MNFTILEHHKGLENITSMMANLVGNYFYLLINLDKTPNHGCDYVIMDWISSWVLLITDLNA